MTAAKRHNSSNAWSQWLPRGLPWLLGPGRPVLIVLVLFALFGGGWYWTWLRVRRRVLSSPEYRVEFDKLEITPLPKWIRRSNVRADVFRQLIGQGPLNIMDEDLPQRIAAAFAQHPWVSKVYSVRKQPLGGVKVELAYRRPVCAVETAQLPLPLPVDEEAVLLPGDDFSPLELNAYPRLTGVDSVPAGLAVGQRWKDARVIGGAEIAAALNPVWKELQLQRIQPTQPGTAPSYASGRMALAGSRDHSGGWVADGSSAAESVPMASIAGPARNKGHGPAEAANGRPSGECRFWLVTRGSRSIYWGYAPGANVAGELPAVDKIARLRRYLADHDSFESSNRQPLDVRAMRPGAAR